MIKTLVARYAGVAVPRYTSYPTAAEFSDDVGAVDQALWLSNLVPDEPVSLYLHVPNCPQLCTYCGSTTRMVLRSAVLPTYRPLLEAEIRLVAQHLTHRPQIGRLHWGGGTPALLEAEGLAAVIETLATVFGFDTTFEHAIELDPRGLSRAAAQSFADVGITRVSLGVQDLDTDVQIAIGRLQPFEIVAEAVANLRTAGIAAIDFDLIYGLPRQTLASAVETARRVVALDPDRIACTGYAHLPARRRNQRLIDAAALPDAAERFRQAEAIGQMLTRAGYDAIGLDHFARPWDGLARASRAGTLRRNFQGYTDDPNPTLIGFGASAVSRFAEGYVQASADVKAYGQALRTGRFAAERGYRFTAQDRVRGAVIERLMCDLKVELDRFGDADDFSDALAVLRPLAEEGIVALGDGSVAVTPLGRPFLRLVAAAFDGFRQGEAKLFGGAV